jgi:hypothetical protein
MCEAAIDCLSLLLKSKGRIPKTMINDYAEVPIGDFKNTLSFPGEETSLDSRPSSHLPVADVPCPSSPPYSFLHHIIGTSKNA